MSILEDALKNIFPSETPITFNQFGDAILNIIKRNPKNLELVMIPKPHSDNKEINYRYYEIICDTRSDLSSDYFIVSLSSQINVEHELKFISLIIRYRELTTIKDVKIDISYKGLDFNDKDICKICVSDLNNPIKHSVEYYTNKEDIFIDTEEFAKMSWYSKVDKSYHKFISVALILVSGYYYNLFSHPVKFKEATPDNTVKENKFIDDKFTATDLYLFMKYMITALPNCQPTNSHPLYIDIASSSESGIKYSFAKGTYCALYVYGWYDKDRITYTLGIYIDDKLQSTIEISVDANEVTNPIVKYNFNGVNSGKSCLIPVNKYECSETPQLSKCNIYELLNSPGRIADYRIIYILLLKYKSQLFNEFKLKY
jgi:hypothetical protein